MIARLLAGQNVGLDRFTCFGFALIQKNTTGVALTLRPFVRCRPGVCCRSLGRLDHETFGRELVTLDLRRIGRRACEKAAVFFAKRANVAELALELLRLSFAAGVLEDQQDLRLAFVA
jgi:hypothetical protein